MELLQQLSQLGERPQLRVPGVGPAQLAALRELQASDRSTCFVLEQDGQVVGTVTLYVLPALSHDGRPFGLIENVVVDQSAQGTGLGRTLMEGVEQKARELGCYKVSFTSNAKRTNAHAFYEHLGFNPTHRGYSKYF
jgi:GNAT superfamily N-acetyltransferase